MCRVLLRAGERRWKHRLEIERCVWIQDEVSFTNRWYLLGAVMLHIMQERLRQSICAYLACTGVAKGQRTWSSNARLGEHFCAAQRTRSDITNIATQPAYPKLHLPRSPISLQPAVDQETKNESSPLICQEMRRDFVCAGSTSRFGHSARPFRIAAFDKRSLSTR